MGTSGSGKTTLINTLSKKWDVPAVDFYTFCKECLENLTNTDEREEFQRVLNEKGDIPGPILTKILNLLYTKEVKSHLYSRICQKDSYYRDSEPKRPILTPH
jgi:adenylate kinase family enzyme